MSRKMTTRYFRSEKEVIEVSTLKKPDKYGFFGWMESHSSGKYVRIWVDDATLERLHIRNGYIRYYDDPSKATIVIDTAMFQDYKRNGFEGPMLLFHEFGHFMLGHLEDDPTVENEFDRRLELLEQDKVSQEELDADAYAAKFIGGDTVYSALWESRESRSALCFFDCDETDEAALKEYDLRMRAIAAAYGLEHDEEEDE